MQLGVSQDFAVVKTLDAEGEVNAVAWSSQFLAAAGDDQKVRVYDSAEDAGAGLLRGKARWSDAVC